MMPGDWAGVAAGITVCLLAGILLFRYVTKKGGNTTATRPPSEIALSPISGGAAAAARQQPRVRLGVVELDSEPSTSTSTSPPPYPSASSARASQRQRRHRGSAVAAAAGVGQDVAIPPTAAAPSTMPETERADAVIARTPGDPRPAATADQAPLRAVDPPAPRTPGPSQTNRLSTRSSLASFHTALSQPFSISSSSGVRGDSASHTRKGKGKGRGKGKETEAPATPIEEEEEAEESSGRGGEC